MNELIHLIEDFLKWIRKIIKIFFYLFLLTFFLFMTGWIKIVCNGDEVLKDVRVVNHFGKGKIYRNDQEKVNNSNQYDYRMSNEIMNSFRKHVLREGESLYELQQYYGIRWEVIKRINQIEDVRKLNAGQVISIPKIENSFDRYNLKRTGLR